PLLGVLPGTGGLTRVVDKRHVRRDLADYFATRPEGVGGRKAVQWRLVDEPVPPGRWGEILFEPARAAAPGAPPLPGGGPGAPGVRLTPLAKSRTDEEIGYRYVSAALDRERRVAEITVRGPDDDAPASMDEVHALGASFWTLAMTRELDDLILDLR